MDSYIEEIVFKDSDWEKLCKHYFGGFSKHKITICVNGVFWTQRAFLRYFCSSIYNKFAWWTQSQNYFFTICNFALFVEQSLKYYYILATSSEARNRSCNVLVLRARVQLFDEEWVHRTRSTRKGAFFRPFWFEITSHPLGAVDCQLHRGKAFRLPVPDAFHTSTLWRTSSAPARVLLPMVALPQSSRRNDQNKGTAHPLLACLTCLFTLRFTRLARF